jgi:hypothetical protein
LQLQPVDDGGHDNDETVDDDDFETKMLLGKMIVWIMKSDRSKSMSMQQTTSNRIRPPVWTAWFFFCEAAGAVIAGIH